MPLPRGDEYNQAVQNPAICFTDNELKSCQVETSPLGLPKPYSGGFTTTYKFKSLTNNWAVRCFTRDIKDLQNRYQSIGNFQAHNNCNFLVGAKYLQNGIKINGVFHPIIKMNWLEGEPLNVYIDRVYNQKVVLENLLNEFISLVKQLERFGIAHGDLQHGNIMVKGGKLFLIDYDGMYLPDLATLSVNELGHPNFQHPRRTAHDYNKNIDRFSIIIIYTALKTIIVNPNLWHKYENGDNLLFRGSDFANPSSSALLKDIAGYPELSKLANNIAAICTLEFSKIPALQEFISNTIASSTRILPQTIIRSAYTILDGSQRGQILERVGERVEVIGRIGGSYNGVTRLGTPYVFLNIGTYPNHTFTIVIWSEGINALRNRGILISNLDYEWVSITGVISTYLGNPQMTLESPSQMQILDSENSARVRLNYSTKSTTPKNQVTTPKQPIKDEDFWDVYLRNKPVTHKPTAQSTSSIGQSKAVTPPNNLTNNTTSTKVNSSKQNERGPMIIFDILHYAILIACIGFIIGNIFGAIVGAFIGGWIGARDTKQ